MRIDIDPKENELEIILAIKVGWGVRTLSMTLKGAVDKDDVLKRVGLALDELKG